MNISITRRQFLQYCAASAAALGLSQTDLLKLEKAMATPQTGCLHPTDPVIWLSGQNCSGCHTTILNRVVEVTGGYYDGDLYGAPCGTPNDGVSDLNVVNDVADLLVGDALGALYGISPRCLTWAPFPNGYVTLEWLTTVNAGAGDIMVDHLGAVVTGSKFLLLFDGSIPTGTATNEKFALAFDETANNWTGLGAGTSVTCADALRWMFNSGNCSAALAIGSCSSWGGIPAAKRQKTGAVSLLDFAAQEGFNTTATGTPIVRVPGCPPHPDWIVAPVAHVLLNGGVPAGVPSLLVPGYLTDDLRPSDVYYESNCNHCRKPDAGFANCLGDDGCLMYLGCKGSSVTADCSSRQKNTFDDGTVRNNWCCGNTDAVPTPGVGDARHPCQGCTEEDFPDWTATGGGFYGICSGC